MTFAGAMACAAIACKTNDPAATAACGATQDPDAAAITTQCRSAALRAERAAGGAIVDGSYRLVEQYGDDGDPCQLYPSTVRETLLVAGDTVRIASSTSGVDQPTGDGAVTYHVAPNGNALDATVSCSDEPDAGTSLDVLSVDFGAAVYFTATPTTLRIFVAPPPEDASSALLRAVYARAP